MDYYFGQENAFHVMAKSTGSECNLDCTYCYYLEKTKLYPRAGTQRMSLKVAEEYVRQYIQAQPVPLVNFVWQGGEPCLNGLEFFKRIVGFQKKYAGNKQITNSFQTNGVLLNKEWCHFFKEHDFLIGISVDGPREIHDYYRRMKSGNPTWDRVMRGVNLLQEHEIEFNTLSVVNDFNVDYPLEVYHFLKEIGSRFHQYIPVVERKAVHESSFPLTLVSPDYRNEARLTDWSVDSRKYGEFLVAIFDEWVRHDVGHYFVQIFDATLASWAGEDPGLCVYQETCGNALVMEHNGDVYSCDHYVYPENCLGNITKNGLDEMVVLPEHIAFGKNKQDRLPEYCRRCEYRFACNGECPKHRFLKAPDGEPGLNYLCEGLKFYYKHAAPYMQFMTNQLKTEQAPANIMECLRINGTLPSS